MIPLTFADDFFAAFLGFLFAILVEIIFRCIDRRARAKHVATELVEELRANKELIDNMDDRQAYASPYQLGSWKVAQFSGDVTALRGLKKARLLLRAFAAIEEASVLERSLFLTSLGNDRQSDGKGRIALRDETIRSRDSVRQMVDEALVEWGDCGDSGK